MMSLFFACGGSGSTGLITLETPLLIEVRESGECREANDTLYCPAQEIDSESSGRPPSEPAPLPNLPEPAPAPDCSEPGACEPPGAFYIFDTSELPRSATCVVATRNDEAAWQLGAPRLVEDGAAPAEFRVPIPATSSVEAALLCFDEAPQSLPYELDFLADASPDLVLVTPRLAAPSS